MNSVLFVRLMRFLIIPLCLLNFLNDLQIVQKYQYVAMDTEFPGVVARPIGEFRSSADYQYQMLRCNVDLLRIIQLGLTFLDDNGKTPGGSYTTWQFNFKFNLQCVYFHKK